MKLQLAGITVLGFTGQEIGLNGIKKVDETLDAHWHHDAVASRLTTLQGANAGLRGC